MGIVLVGRQAMSFFLFYVVLYEKRGHCNLRARLMSAGTDRICSWLILAQYTEGERCTDAPEFLVWMCTYRSFAGHFKLAESGYLR
jgi:hypothetical protein